MLVAPHGQWRSLVARFVRDEEVVGSNPACPTGQRPPLNSRSPAGVETLLHSPDMEIGIFLLRHLEDAGAMALGMFALVAQEGYPCISGKVDDTPV